MIRHKVVDGVGTVTVSRARLCFDDHRDFRTACESVLQHSGVTTVVVDMESVDYIDSAALGMMLIVKEKADAQKARVRIENCADSVHQILTIASFQKLFDITKRA